MSDITHASLGFSEQLPKNLIANIANFLLNVIVGIFLVPYFVHTLGVAAYGIIPLATSLTGYVGLLTDSLNSAVSRYLTVDLHRENYVLANKTFNTAFFAISGLILIMVPVVALISFFSPIIFKVPQGQEIGTILIFLGVSFAFLIRSWSSNFTVSLFAYNRLDLLNLVNIVNFIVQVLLIVFFFSFVNASLALVGLAYLIGSITASIFAIFLSRRINPHLKINIHDFDRPRLNEIAGMVWWVMVNQVGYVLILPTYLVVVNIIFGATASGEFAIALTMVTLLYAIAGTLGGVLTPVVLSYYAKDRLDALTKLTKSAVKLMGLAMALPIGLICGLSPFLLTVWVGKQYSSLALLMVLLTFHLTLNLAVIPLFSINVAFNRVKIPGISTLLAGIGNVLLAVFLSLNTSWGYYSVAIASAVVLFIKNGLFIPWYSTRILDVPSLTFWRSIVAGIIATIAVALVAYVFSQFIPITGYVSLIFAGLCVSVVYLAAIWAIGLSRFERKLFLSFLPKRVMVYMK